MLKSKIKNPKQERSKFTVEAILEATTHLFEKEGRFNLTTNKIAEFAGVSVGSLYQYFKNKESIIETILLKMVDKNLATVDLALSQQPHKIDIRVTLTILIETMFNFTSNRQKFVNYLFTYAPKILSEHHFKKCDEKVVSFLMKKIEEYQIEIRPQNKEHAFFICAQAVRGVMVMSIIQKNPDEHQSIINELIDMLSTYLTP